MATKKQTPFQKLINIIESFDAKREAKYVPMDTPTAELYQQICQWARYADEAYQASRYDLTKLICPEIGGYISKLYDISNYLNTGKFSEHKEADIIQSEWLAITKLWNVITEELFGISTAWEDDEEESE